MNVLITGASGSVAHYLIDHIKRVQPEASITGIGRRLNSCVESETCHYHSVDLARPWGMSFLRQTIAATRPSVVFHLASMAQVNPSFADPGGYLDNNVQCTINLYEAMREEKFGGTCVLASTSEVYGHALSLTIPPPYSQNPIREIQPFAPVNPYGISKCTQEHLAQFYFGAHGVKIVTTRAFGYINPLRKDLVATAVARQKAEAEKNGGGTVRHGNTAPVRTFCDVRDVAEAYWLAATMCEPGEAYNIGGEDGITIGDLIQLLAGAAGNPANLEFVRDDSLLRPTDVSRCVPDCSKFRRATGWKPKIPLKESLEWLIQCVRNERRT